MKKKLFTLLLSFVAIFTLAACGGNNEEGTAPSETDNPQTETTEAGDGEPITIGCMPLNKEINDKLSEILVENVYDLEVTVFDGNSLPAQALVADEIDTLILNHKPWIETFNQENGSDLYMVDGFSYASLLGLYSSKIESVEEMPENAKVTISNDPSNMERGLLFMQELGLIKLGEKSDNFYSVVDIEDNPKNIEFVDVEITMTAGSYEDADAVLTMSSVMHNAGYDARSYIVEDGLSKDYPIGFVVNKGEENEPWVKALVDAANTPEFEEYFDEVYQGAYVIIK